MRHADNRLIGPHLESYVNTHRKDDPIGASVTIWSDSYKTLNVNPKNGVFVLRKVTLYFMFTLTRVKKLSQYFNFY